LLLSFSPSPALRIRRAAPTALAGYFALMLLTSSSLAAANDEDLISLLQPQKCFAIVAAARCDAPAQLGAAQESTPGLELPVAAPIGRLLVSPQLRPFDSILANLSIPAAARDAGTIDLSAASSVFAGASDLPVPAVPEPGAASVPNLYVEARDSDSVGRAINAWLLEAFGRRVAGAEANTGILDLPPLSGAVGLQARISDSLAIFGEAGMRINPGFEFATPRTMFGIRTRF